MTNNFKYPLPYTPKNPRYEDSMPQTTWKRLIGVDMRKFFFRCQNLRTGTYGMHTDLFVPEVSFFKGFPVNSDSLSWFWVYLNSQRNKKALRYFALNPRRWVRFFKEMYEVEPNAYLAAYIKSLQTKIDSESVPHSSIAPQTKLSSEVTHD